MWFETSWAGIWQSRFGALWPQVQFGSLHYGLSIASPCCPRQPEDHINGLDTGVKLGHTGYFHTRHVWGRLFWLFNSYSLVYFIPAGEKHNFQTWVNAPTPGNISEWGALIAKSCVKWYLFLLNFLEIKYLMILYFIERTENNLTQIETIKQNKIDKIM